jgi:hypothetical protein
MQVVTFSVVIRVENDEYVLDEADQGERPDDEAEDAEEVLPGVRQGEGRECVQRRRPDVAVPRPATGSSAAPPATS